jgi:hypothetical protein
MRRRYSRIAVFGLACAGLLLAAAPVLAQGMARTPGSYMGSNVGSSSSLGSNLGTSSTGSFIGTNTGSFIGTNTGSFIGANTGSFIGTSTGSFTGTPGTQTGTPGRTGTGTTTPGATSFLGANYANPIAMGAGNGTVARFGSVMYTIAGTSQNPTGAANISTANAANQQYGAGYNIRRLPSYAATLAIKDMPPPPTAPQVQADIQGMLAQSSQLDSGDRIRVVIDGPAVVLQGQVADDEERRLVENMVRLTPGVYKIRNELAPRVASR